MTDDTMPNDPLEGWEMDQTQADIRNTAPIVAAMFKELRGQGLTGREAADLAGAWVAALGR